jgi:hypothetical protein
MMIYSREMEIIEKRKIMIIPEVAMIMNENFI